MNCLKINNLSVEYNTRLSGFVGGTKYIVSVDGKLKQKNNACPRCAGMNYVDNGFHILENYLLLCLGLKIKISQFLCCDCGCCWSSGIEFVDKIIKEFNDFLKSLLLGCARAGMSFGGACSLVEEKIGKTYSPQYLEEIYSEALDKIKQEKFSSASGVYHYDEQYLLVNGEEKCRLTIKDAVTEKIILDIQTADSRKETIAKILSKALKDLPVEAFILDMRREYPEIIKELFPKAKIQWCIFHLYKIIWKEFKEEYGKFLPLRELYNAYSLFDIFFDHESELKKLEELLKKFERFKTGELKSDKEVEKCLIQEFRRFIKELKRERRKNGEKVSRRTLEKSQKRFELIKKQIYLFSRNIQKRILYIADNWEKFTLFQHDKRVPPTNNGLEHYFAATLCKTDKKDFRSQNTVIRELKAFQAEWNGQEILPNNNLLKIFSSIGMLFLAFPPT